MRESAFIILPAYLKDLRVDDYHTVLNLVVSEIISPFCEMNVMTYDVIMGEAPRKGRYFFDYCTPYIDERHIESIGGMIDDPYVLVYPVLNDQGLGYDFSEKGVTMPKADHAALCAKQFAIHKGAFGVWVNFHS
jgi:hypothetical protein